MATVAELIDTQFRREGHGLLAGDSVFRHREVTGNAATRAAYLADHHQKGVEPHVGVLLDNTPEYVLARGTAVGRTDPTLSIVDLETGGRCPVGEFDGDGRLLNGVRAIGELVKPGTGAFTGYWKNPEADAERVRDGVFHSGDLFYADDEGWLYFAARKADKMRVDGENISVALLEAILSRWESVDSVAVYGCRTWSLATR